jgi:type II secretory ATPase GspE/PulE/Tfp pilus assembly ATPase PilB-like protein
MDPKDLTQEQPHVQDPNVKTLGDASSQINQDFKERSIEDKAKSSGGKYGYIDIARTPINPDLFYLVDANEAEQALTIPFFRLGKKLRVATSDPENTGAKTILNNFVTQGYEVQINLASAEGIQKALVQFHNAQMKPKTKIQTGFDESQLEEYQKELENLAHLADKIQASSAKEGLNILEIGAIKTGASDIHFQPEEEKVLIRFRIDGLLQEVTSISFDVYKQLAQQIKYDSGMKLNVTSVPQDGRTQFEVNGREIDVRVSALPTGFGETLVLRILDSGKQFGNFEELGFSADHLQTLDEISKLSQGMILVTGPTGSGKTTTLYTLLERYNTPERKIITLEDPIEYKLGRIVQSQINEAKGYTFAGGLESVLRQDPDVVMIGEIRDLDTANTATQAALTGHVMLSTLHTNSALESVPRLINMGLKPFTVAPALDTMIAQRLVRGFCPHCVKNEALSPEQVKHLQEELTKVATKTGQTYSIPVELPKACGCEICNNTGYLGRIVVAEIIRIDDEFRELILGEASLLDMRKEMNKRGILTMYEDGLLKVIAGKTSLEEILRVTS